MAGGGEVKEGLRGFFLFVCMMSALAFVEAFVFVAYWLLRSSGGIDIRAVLWCAVGSILIGTWSGLHLVALSD